MRRPRWWPARRRAVVFWPISPAAAEATLAALRGLDEEDRTLGAVLSLLARLHARVLVEAEGAAAPAATARAVELARGVRLSIDEIVAATRGAPERPRRGGRAR